MFLFIAEVISWYMRYDIFAFVTVPCAMLVYSAEAILSHVALTIMHSLPAISHSPRISQKSYFPRISQKSHIPKISGKNTYSQNIWKNHIFPEYLKKRKLTYSLNVWKITYSLNIWQNPIFPGYLKNLDIPRISEWNIT